ncbi:hypothetical protein DH2020_004923 [Rehmannia glutinosa]|uniref:F-box domain-containing protein n=1 Tax=Rehmannia glutinosa TaxID=99300 RepID=A0ABR0XQV0_REHGL
MGKKPAAQRGEDGSKSMDRISNLPQPILHHILSFLSQKEAIQTCVLSKSWRYLGSTRPNIEFCESHFRSGRKKEKEETFLSVLDKTLQGYHDQKLSIRKFVVEMPMVDSRPISFLEKWIPIVILDMGVKSFSLSFRLQESEYFDLPSIVFEAESLQELYLERCELNSIDNVMLKHLQTLCLQRVYITEETFEKILSSCPLIENVSLLGCKGFKSIKVNKPHNLNYFAFNDTYELYKKQDNVIRIEIDVQTIKTIRIVGCLNWIHHHIYFPHLSCLFLSRVSLSSESFGFFSCNFPSLENLTLHYCFGFKEFHLLSRSIKHLRVCGMKKPIKATVDAPNIRMFKYEGDNIPQSITFTTTSSEWKSNIILWSYSDFDYHASSWFHKLHELLMALSQSEISLKMPQERRRNQKIEDPLSLVPTDINNYGGGFYKPVVVENLSVRGYYPYSSFPGFLRCLFRICRPRYISQCLYLDAHSEWEREEKQLTEFLLVILLIKKNMRQYVWLQDLEEVSMEEFDENGQELHPLDMINVRLRLKWRE